MSAHLLIPSKSFDVRPDELYCAHSDRKSMKISSILDFKLPKFLTEMIIKYSISFSSKNNINFEYLSWHHSNFFIAVRHQPHYICIYDVRNNKWLPNEIIIENESNKIFSMKWLAHSDNLLVTTADSLYIFAIDFKNGAVSLRSGALPNNSNWLSWLTSLALRSDGVEFKHIHGMAVHTSAEVSPQGRLFATLRSGDNCVCIWDAGLLHFTSVYCLNGTQANLLKWSPSGAHLAVTNCLGDLFLVRCDTWRHAHCLHIDRDTKITHSSSCNSIRSVVWLRDSSSSSAHYRLLVIKQNSTSVYICSVIESQSQSSSEVDNNNDDNDKINVNIIPAPFHITPPTMSQCQCPPLKSSSLLSSTDVIIRNDASVQQSIDNHTSSSTNTATEVEMMIDRVVSSSCGRFIAVSFYNKNETRKVSATVERTDNNNNNSPPCESFVALYTCHQQSPSLMLSFTLLRILFPKADTDDFRTDESSNSPSPSASIDSLFPRDFQFGPKSSSIQSLMTSSSSISSMSSHKITNKLTHHQHQHQQQLMIVWSNDVLSIHDFM